MESRAPWTWTRTARTRLCAARALTVAKVFLDTCVGVWLVDMEPSSLLAVLALVLSVGFGTEEGACQHCFLLRPVPGDGLPVEALQEDPDPALDPTERDLNVTELRGLLGARFDPRFMSASPPQEPPDSPGIPEPPRGRKLRRRLQQWLWARAACPVQHAWSDLGARFWPRYVKVGSCSNKRSCSVPEGMLCTPARAAHVTLLRWRCRRRNALRCAWIPVQYPLISECKCACPS